MAGRLAPSEPRPTGSLAANSAGSFYFDQPGLDNLVEVTMDSSENLPFHWGTINLAHNLVYASAFPDCYCCIFKLQTLLVS